MKLIFSIFTIDINSIKDYFESKILAFKNLKKKLCAKPLKPSTIFLDLKLIREVAIHPSEIESRLKSVNVYALMDLDRTSLFTTGYLERSLCPFFLNRHIAELYESSFVIKCLDMICKTCITEISLNQIFKFINYDVSNSIMKNVTFRFIPDPTEVLEALQLLHKTEKSKIHSDLCFEGVPLFHTRSLELKPTSESTRVLPLFLSKHDLDIAIKRAKTEKKYLGTKNNEIKSTNLDYAAGKGKSWTTSIDNMIEVGCLEWVLQQMEEDEKGVWTEALIIPPGFMDSDSSNSNL
eukprot:gnl/TRDRNA2_/TRDRNA2_176964_c0_seq1.p1 gnl/TRDRNA2_/TRDRNA2_176964_c0~~gnl/TRDRNA2_/TRDRNA2_176964_c0_seq1.p1  ORF type:complete len:293 (+),score=-14.59 gnl/TRDRNA2_/TRDRNA2_176964_c0_seq1:67-945(+)